MTPSGHPKFPDEFIAGEDLPMYSLFVANLSQEVNEEDLDAVFRPVAEEASTPPTIMQVDTYQHTAEEHTQLSAEAEGTHSSLFKSIAPPPTSSYFLSQIVREKRTGDSKNYGFVHCLTQTARQAILDKFTQGVTIRNRVAKLQPAEDKKLLLIGQLPTNKEFVNEEGHTEDIDDQLIKNQLATVGGRYESIVLRGEFAYITYRNFRLAERALSKLDGASFLGSVLYAEPARITQNNANANKKDEDNFQLDSTLISKLDERAEAMCSLHVKNIAPQTTQKAFFDLFSQYGKIVQVRVPRDHSGINRGYAFVQFTNSSEAAAAMRSVKQGNVTLDGNIVDVEYTKGDGPNKHSSTPASHSNSASSSSSLHNKSNGFQNPRHSRNHGNPHSSTSTRDNRSSHRNGPNKKFGSAPHSRSQPYPPADYPYNYNPYDYPQYPYPVPPNATASSSIPPVNSNTSSSTSSSNAANSSSSHRHHGSAPPFSNLSYYPPSYYPPLAYPPTHSANPTTSGSSNSSHRRSRDQNNSSTSSPPSASSIPPSSTSPADPYSNGLVSVWDDRTRSYVMMPYFGHPQGHHHHSASSLSSSSSAHSNSNEGSKDKDYHHSSHSHSHRDKRKERSDRTTSDKRTTSSKDSSKDKAKSSSGSHSHSHSHSRSRSRSRDRHSHRDRESHREHRKRDRSRSHSKSHSRSRSRSR